jgi:hypothetical protein
MKSTRPFGPDQAEPANTCGHCGSERIITRRCLKGPHFGRLQCKDCGAFCGWDRKPLGAATAGAFVMPFGRHRDERLSEIDTGYLEWLVRKFDSRLSRAAALVLEGRRAAARKGGAR